MESSSRTAIVASVAAAGAGGLMSSFLDPVRAVVGELRKHVDRLAVANPALLDRYERRANGPSVRQRMRLQGHSHLNLMGTHVRFARNQWTVDDGVARYRLPLRSEYAGFDWARALCALGHDAEVKQVYRFLVGAYPPGVFIDIGANFGQHTDYFIAAGWRVVSFEPNPNCGAYHRQICELNGWRHDEWRQVALSDTPGKAFLSFPAGKEWLGKLGIGAPQPGGDTVVEVEVQRLSDILPSVADCIVKIDVEGHEQSVLRGFPADLGRVKGIVFEALTHDELRHLRERFEGEGLVVYALAIDETRDPAEAVDAGLPNFVAAPRDSKLHEWLAARLRAGR